LGGEGPTSQENVGGQLEDLRGAKDLCNGDESAMQQTREKTVKEPKNLRKKKKSQFEGVNKSKGVYTKHCRGRQRDLGTGHGRTCPKKHSHRGDKRKG